VKHYGDITKINGAEAPVVDIITGGSPCQDLSVAGKRAGLAGERSGLFMEQIRIVKEMRQQDVRSGRNFAYARPRYMVWENVPGAFSSGNPKGADFAAVIEEIIKVAEPGVAVSVCVPNGGWTKSGCYYAEDGSWSVAWRVHDAQFWGVPQRRKRIALVADFGGLSAPEILFERKGLSGDSEPGRTARKETAGAVGGGVANTGGAMNPWDSQSARVYPDNGVWHSLNANENGGQSRDSVLQTREPIPINTMIAVRGKALGRGTGFGVSNPGDPAFTISAAHEHADFCLQGNGIDRADTAGCNGRGWCEDVSYTLNTIDRPAVAFTQNQRNEVRDLGDMAGALAAEPGVHQQTYVYDARGNGDGKTVCTITGDHQNRVTDYTALCVGNGQLNQISMGVDGYNGVAYGFEPGAAKRMDAENRMNLELSPTLRADMGDNQVAVACAYSETYPVQNSVVRRLTPLECERLQGYPDGWTDIGEWVDSKGKKHKDADSPRYKALGNSIALPFWQWMAKRICAQYERTPTMASLFDGIGGFPLVFSRAGAVPVWASEIEEFPIAVTKVRFPDESM